MAKNPLENKELLVRVTLAGRMGKPIRARLKGLVAMARSFLFIRLFSDSRHDKPRLKVEEKQVRQVQFHVKSNDYFGTLATVLDLIRQSIEKERNTSKRRWYLGAIKSVVDDLMFLQKNYKIVEREESEMN